MADGERRCRVLIIDDDQDIRESTALVIGMLGHDVVTAGDGASGIAEARNFLPELVLLDLGLPDMHGHDVARALRAEPRGAEMLLTAVTGWVRDEDRSAVMEAGFDLHVSKPVDLATLRDLIRRAAAGRERAVTSG